MKRIFLILFLLQGVFSACAQKTDSINYKKTLSEFRTFHQQLTKTRQKARLSKVTPVDEAVIFEEVFSTSKHSLLKNLRQYAPFLSQALSDTAINKADEFDLDVIRLMFHLCVDDYSQFLDSIYTGYLNGRVKIDLLHYALVTYDNHYSNILVLGYKSNKLQSVLLKMLSNPRFIEEGNRFDPTLEKSLKRIASGELYEIFTTDERTWFFAIETCQ